MAKTKTVEYTLSLDDLATSVYQKFVGAVQSGEIDISKAVKGSTGAFDQHGKSIQGVTGWIKQQRTEQRQQNFLFREAQQALNASALALTLFSTAGGKSNENLKKLSEGLNAGIVGFQGLGAITSFLPGPIGLAVQAIGGIAVGLAVATRETDNFEDRQKRLNETLEKTIELRIKLNQLPESATADLQKQLDEVERGIELAKRSGADATFLQQRRLELLDQIQQREKGIETVRSRELQTLFPAALKLYQDATDAVKAQADFQAKIVKLIEEGNTAEADRLTKLHAQLAAIEKGNTEIGIQKRIDELTRESKMLDVNSLQWSRNRAEIDLLKGSLEELNKPPKSLWLFNFGIEMQKSFEGGRQAVQTFRDGMKALFGSGPSEEVKIQLAIEADVSRMERSLMSETELINEWEASIVESATATEEQKTRATQVAARRRAQIELETNKRTFQQVGQLAMQAFNIIGRFGAQAAESRLIDIQTEKDAALAALDEKLNAEGVSEEQRKVLLAERRKVQEGFEAQERTARTEAFNAEKSAAIIQSIIQTALAVVEALPNIPLSIAVGILGAAQTALIAGQPTPKFHEGSGGPVFFDAPSSRNIPILVRGGETFEVKTESQRSAQPVVINIYGPISTAEAFKQIVQHGMREMGINDVSLYFRNNRASLQAA